MLKRILFVFPALALISSCHSGSGKPANADSAVKVDSLANINQRIRKTPDNLDLYIQRAKIYMNRKDIPSAVADVDRVLRIDSSKADYLIVAGDAYFFSRKISRADQLFQRATEIDPTNVNGLLRLAQLDHYLEKYDQEMPLLDKALRQDVHNAQAYFMKGMVFKQHNDTADAISSMQTAVEQDPDYYNAFIQLGMLTAAQRNPIAESYYLNALKIQPTSREAMYDLGMFYTQQKEWDKAKNAFNSILKNDQHDYDAHFCLGNIGVQQGQYEDGMSYFTMAIDDNAKDPRAFFGRAVCKTKKNDIAGAEQDLQEALKLNPQYDFAAHLLDSLKNSER